ncbi:MAG: TIGR03545 family protein [Planctomycetales bacterium]|nr:TIGR03545 family protein [Planctomycetales bacterium]
MIRWKYVAPRLAVVLVLLASLHFGLDPVLRWAMISAGQAVTGARVDVAAVSTSLGRTELVVQGLAVANPAAPDFNLVQADYLWLDLDAAALAERRFVVDHGVVHGLTINAAREASGRLDAQEPRDEADSASGDNVKQWLLSAAQGLGDEVADDLESVRLARELSERWPAEYRDLERRIDAWIAQAEQLRALPDLLKSGDLAQNAQQIQRASLTLKSLKDELTELRADFQTLAQQARVDRTDLSAASQRDIDKIKRRFDPDQLKPDAITDYLLGPELGAQARETLAWLRWARGHAPSQDLPQPSRSRGTDVALFNGARQPWLLVRSLEIHGQIDAGQGLHPFAALAEGLTTEPKLYGQPTTIKIKTSTPAECWIDVALDRTGEMPLDHLTLACPHIVRKEQTLGDSQSLAVDVAPGKMQIAADLHLRGDTLAGDIRLRRDAAWRLHVSPQLGGDGLESRMQERLASVDAIEATVSLEGTLETPKMTFRSPIGKELQIALRGALADEIAARTQRLEAKTRRRIDAEITRLESQVATQKQAALKKLSLADAQSDSVERLVADSLGLSKQRLGRELLRAVQRR